MGVWFAVESAYQVRMVDENREELNQFKQYYEAVINKAATLAGRRK